MRPMRWLVVGGILFLILAAMWFALSRTELSQLAPFAGLQTTIDFALIGLSAVILGWVIWISTRRLNHEETRRNALALELARQQARLSAVMQTAHAINFETNLKPNLEYICREAALALAVEAATVTVYQAERGLIELAATAGLPASFEEGCKPVPYSASYLFLLAQGNPIVLSGGDSQLSHLPFGDLYRAWNFGTVVYMQLNDDSGFLGELTLLARKPQVELSPDDLAAMKAFGDQACLAVRFDRLRAEARDSARRLEVLRSGDLAILSSLDLNLTLRVFLQAVYDHLKVDAADVLLFNPGAQELEYSAGIGMVTDAMKNSRVPLDTGYAGKIALERRSMYFSDITAAGPFSRHGLMAREGFVSYFGSPLIAKGQVKGVLEVFHRKSFHPQDSWLSFLETLAGQAAIAIDNASLYSNLQLTITNLALAYDRTLEGWSRALDLRDRETEGHTKRVSDLCMRLAREFNFDESGLVNMRRGALLHDIGKMGIPDEVLHKAEKFSEEDVAIMRQHPCFAFEMLSPITFLQSALDIPYCHHERWDGSGYPRGLRGEVIPLVARIFAVADVWDALTTDRPYRKALPPDEAAQHLRAEAGKQFDPQVVDAFLRIIAQPA